MDLAKNIWVTDFVQNSRDLILDDMALLVWRFPKKHYLATINGYSSTEGEKVACRKPYSAAK